MRKQRRSHYLLFLLFLLLYMAIGYGIERHETLPLFTAYFTTFAAYVFVARHHETMDANEFRFWLGAAVVFRLGLLFSVPALSDDFYRFIWDGRLLAAGHHPFAEVPAYYMTHPHHIPGIDIALYDKLGAKETFTVYPPVAQFIYWMSAKFSPASVYGSMMVMKVILFAFEVATLWILPKVLRRFGQPVSRTLLYALNPLVILEFTGNLHFEGIVIFFLVSAVLLMERKPVISAAVYALAICTKLIPLLFLPLLWHYLGWKKALTYWILVAVFSVVLFLPLLDPAIIRGFSTSLGYYFLRFEFNASVYYLIREAGWYFAGFNIIQYAGPFLGAAAGVLILYISFKRWTGNNDLFTRMLCCLVIYFFSVTILHPWYILTLLAISLLTPYRFPLVWTGAVFLTYAGYSPTGFDENLWLVALEYIIVTGYMLYETAWKKRNLF